MENGKKSWRMGESPEAEEEEYRALAARSLKEVWDNPSDEKASRFYEKIAFSSGKPDLSRKIDEVLYNKKK